MYCANAHYSRRDYLRNGSSETGTMNNKPKVYFPLWEDSKYDISKAKEFGEIVYALEGCTRNPFDTESIIGHCRNLMQELKPYDYIGLTGNQVYVAILTALAFEECELNLLLFDARTNEYRERKLTGVDWLEVRERE